MATCLGIDCGTQRTNSFPEETAAFGAALQAYRSYLKHRGEKTNFNAILSDHVVLDDRKRHEPEGGGGRIEQYHTVYAQYLNILNTVSPLLK